MMQNQIPLLDSTFFFLQLKKNIENALKTKSYWGKKISPPFYSFRLDEVSKQSHSNFSYLMKPVDTKNNKFQHQKMKKSIPFSFLVVF